MKRIICIVTCLFAGIYSLGYASLGGFHSNSGALSKIGLEHPVLFAIWGLLTIIALTYNIIIAFMKTKYRFYIILLIISIAGMILTICFDFDYSKHTEYVLHCAGSLTFSAVMGITVFLLFLLSKNYMFTVISGAVLITDLILLIIFKETALIELMPILSGYIMLCIHNLKKENVKIEIK